jgi:hypothetical protein
LTVSVLDVQLFLKELPEEFVPTTTIAKQLEIANWKVNADKSSAATATDVDNAVLIMAAYFSTLAYMAEAERSLGVIPASIEVIASELKDQMAEALKLVKRGAGAGVVQESSIITKTTTARDWVSE